MRFLDRNGVTFVSVRALMTTTSPGRFCEHVCPFRAVRAERISERTRDKMRAGPAGKAQRIGGKLISLGIHDLRSNGGALVLLILRMAASESSRCRHL